MARSLHSWLPKVIPNLKPWMSELDIDKGTDWSDELHGFLAEAKAVIVCVTPENVRSPWLYYECGQIAARSEANLICPYLLENERTILADGPLARFQHTNAVKDDSFRLWSKLNRSLGDRGVSESEIGASFEREWLDLQLSLNRIRAIASGPATPASEVATDIDRLVGGSLSADARAMLLEMAQDPQGLILCVATSGGDHFETNGKDLNEENTPRSTAKWRAALQNLARRQLVQPEGRKGEVFSVTAKGYEVFDFLRSRMQAM